MKIYIIFLLLCICIIIQQISIQRLTKDIKQLKENQEVLRKVINDLDKKINKILVG